ncbi:MAG TPA: A24 family peptidase [Sphingomicrobium sp.]|nr:A24 family peptidase [Sphingomicrobium sp.]
MTVALAVAGALIGAIVGSFIATLCIRWPRGEQATAGRSKCDGCGRPLAAFELVPIASGLLARGKCRTCGAPIDPFHMKVELAAAAIGATALAIAPDLRGAALALFCWLLLAPAILDARHHWLPDRLTAALAIAGLAAGGLLSGVPLLHRLIGGVAGFCFLALLAIGYRRARGREGLGAGDAKLLGAIGLWTGWAALPAILLIASVTGLASAAVERRGRLEAVAFGSLLAFAAAIWSVAVLLFPGLGGAR